MHDSSIFKPIKYSLLFSINDNSSINISLFFPCSLIYKTYLFLLNFCFIYNLKIFTFLDSSYKVNKGYICLSLTKSNASILRQNEKNIIVFINLSLLNLNDILESIPLYLKTLTESKLEVNSSNNDCNKS